MGINLVNVQVWGHSQQDVLEAVKLEFGRFFGGNEYTRKKHLGFSPEEYARMLEYRRQAMNWVEALGDRSAVTPGASTLVGPKLGGWVGVYDAAMEGQNGKFCEAAARRLSGRLKTAVLTLMVRESRSFLYVLGSNGVSLDWYMHGPDFGPTAPPPVHAEAVSRSLGKPERAAAIEAALSPPDEGAMPPANEAALSPGRPEPDPASLAGGAGGTAGYDLLTGLARVLDIRNADLSFRGLALAGPGRA